MGKIAWQGLDPASFNDGSLFTDCDRVTNRVPRESAENGIEDTAP
jgi:hypothetical protein